MNFIKTKRGHVKGCLTRAVSFAESVDQRISLELLEIRVQKLEEKWTEFWLLQKQLLEFAGETDFVDPEPEFAEYESKYFVAQSTLTKVIRDRRKTGKPSTSQSVFDKLASQQDDHDSRQACAEQVGSREDCTVDELVTFSQLRCDALESCQSLSRLNLSRGKPPRQFNHTLRNPIQIALNASHITH